MSAYQTLTLGDSRVFAGCRSCNGQLLLPMVNRFEEARAAIDEVIDVARCACIQAILEASTADVAGPRSPEKRSGDVRYHGQQDGVVHLKERSSAFAAASRQFRKMMGHQQLRMRTPRGCLRGDDPLPPHRRRVGLDRIDAHSMAAPAG